MNIYLVRHGQSEGNVDLSVHTQKADHTIPLTEEGKRQAKEAGLFLQEYLAEHKISRFRQQLSYLGLPTIPKIKLWNSPYARARQTAEIISGVCLLQEDVSPSSREVKNSGSSWFAERAEHLLLAEHQFGIFDGLSDDDVQVQFPKEFAYYTKCKQSHGEVWATMPQGESKFQVAQRLHQVISDFHREDSRKAITNLVVVAHGTVNRLFTMMWLNKPYEWFHDEPNPNNCSVRHLTDGEDKGYIFEGFA